MSEEWTAKPYAQWLEGTIQKMVEIDPVSICFAIMCQDGTAATCYYNVSMNDRALMIDAMREDTLWRWLEDNRDEIIAVLNGEAGEEGEEDGEELPDDNPEADE